MDYMYILFLNDFINCFQSLNKLKKDLLKERLLSIINSLFELSTLLSSLLVLTRTINWTLLNLSLFEDIPSTYVLTPHHMLHIIIEYFSKISPKNSIRTKNSS